MSDHSAPAEFKSGVLLSAIAVILTGYVVALALGYPQLGTQMIVEAAAHGHDHEHEDHSHTNDHHDDESDDHHDEEKTHQDEESQDDKTNEDSDANQAETIPAPEDTEAQDDKDEEKSSDPKVEASDLTDDSKPKDPGAEPKKAGSDEEKTEEDAEHHEDKHAHGDDHGGDSHSDSGHDAHAATTPPPKYTVIPFVILLLCIAVLPLIPQTEHWWENNSSRFMVAASLGVVTLLYYLLFHSDPVDRHFLGHAVIDPSESGLNWGVAWTIFQNAMFEEYIPFIVLLFSLFTISGGIRIEGDLRAHPATNMTFIAVGGLLASFIGTTGAAMLLIRPLLDTNIERAHVKHTVVFFIFVVCNCGGCLLPIGDPPLFLGYLKGVEFFWTMSLWEEWLFVNCCLLALYYVVDRFYYYPKETVRDIARDETQTRKLSFSGLINIVWLLGVILAVAFLAPTKTVPGTDGWHPWLFLREIVQIIMVGLSLVTTAPKIRVHNQFSFHAIVEVAALFCGIFICMQPALQNLNASGGYLVENFIDSPNKFFWITGGLSSVLDNAPTYLVFFETASKMEVDPALAVPGVTPAIDSVVLTAISLGAVFMGAMTYIGNGPNFMVKSIAENAGIKMPSFFGYAGYSTVYLLPILVALVAWRFLI